MAKNCGCKPCGKPLPKATKVCKPFSFCAGNKMIIWDGDCLYEQERTFQIPDGTYTSITFTGGCITAVGQAPIQQYTPQQCCDSDNTPDTPQGGSNLTASKEQGNLAVIRNGVITVKPMWDAVGNIQISGNGTVDKPWKPSIRISKDPSNTLAELADGLYANTHFKSSPTVTVSGKGTKLDPYQFSVKGSEATLPEINKDEYSKQGITIREDGRVQVEDGLKLVTNLSFNNDAFTVDDTPQGTTVNVDLAKLMAALEPHLRQLGYCKCDEKPSTPAPTPRPNSGGGLSEGTEVRPNTGNGGGGLSDAAELRTG